MRQGAGRMGTVPAGHHGPLAILPALPATDVPRVSQVQPSPVTPALAITAYTATTALGRGRDAQASALRERRGGLRRNDFGTGAVGEQRLDTWIGRVDGLEDAALPAGFARLDCRNNRLAWLALQQDAMAERIDDLRARHRPERVALVLGTSTSSIGATEEAYARLSDDGLRFPPALDAPILHTPHSLGPFGPRPPGLPGPCIPVATPCTSAAQGCEQPARPGGAGPRTGGAPG